MTEAPAELRIAVAAFAARPRVLVAVDFDGTLAPFVQDPMQARAVPGGLEALRAAAELDGVSAAVVSGRDLATLAALTGFGRDDAVTLIGSHGAQTSQTNETSNAGADSAVLDEDAAARLTAITEELEAIRAHYPMVRVEHKPAAVVLHTRGVEDSVAAGASAAALEMGERHRGVQVIPGKNVVELTVLEADKGSAVVALARSTGSAARLYVGDDVTDERAFAALDPASGDLTVKVGRGDTLAAHRVPDPDAVVRLLELFVAERQAAQRPLAT